MRASIRATTLTLCGLGLACSQPPPPSTGQATAGIDSLNARLIRAYQSRDPQAYAELYTDTAVFEWPAFNTVRGPAELAAMARSNWASLNDMDLRLTISTRRVAPDHATEFGAFQQSWRDSGTRAHDGVRKVRRLPGPAGRWQLADRPLLRLCGLDSAAAYPAVSALAVGRRVPSSLTSGETPAVHVPGPNDSAHGRMPVRRLLFSRTSGSAANSHAILPIMHRPVHRAHRIRGRLCLGQHTP